jgi:hypothetical protein
MTRETKRVSKQVVRLTDPHPERVSLVAHGANQTPFKSVKHDDVTIADLSDEQGKETVMSKKDTTSEKIDKTETKPGTEIHKVAFKGENFKDEAAVASYMESKGYRDVRIEKIDDGFVVNGVDESAFEEIHSLPADEGVTMFVGKLDPSKKTDFSVSIRMVANPGEKKGTTSIEGAAASAASSNKPEDAAADPKPGMSTGPTISFAPAAGVDGSNSSQKGAKGKEKPSAKEAKENRRKVDSYQAYYNTDDVTIADVLEDANDGIPVGFYDVTTGFVTALKNLVTKGDSKGISALTSEYGTLLTKLVTLTSGLTKKEDREAAFESLFAPQQSDSRKGTDELTAKAAEAIKKLKAEQPATATGLESIIALLTEQLSMLRGAVTKADIEAALKPVHEQIAKVENRTVELEKVRQTRKSLPVEDVTTGGEGEQGKETKPSHLSAVIAVPSRKHAQIL